MCLQGSLKNAVTAFNKACPCMITWQKELTLCVLFFCPALYHYTSKTSLQVALDDLRCPACSQPSTWGASWWYMPGLLLVLDRPALVHLLCQLRSGLISPPQTEGRPSVINLPSLERIASSIGVLLQAIFLPSSRRWAPPSQHPRMISSWPGPV